MVDFVYTKYTFSALIILPTLKSSLSIIFASSVGAAPFSPLGPTDFPPFVSKNKSLILVCEQNAVAHHVVPHDGGLIVF